MQRGKMTGICKLRRHLTVLLPTKVKKTVKLSYTDILAMTIVNGPVIAIMFTQFVFAKIIITMVLFDILSDLHKQL